MSRRIAAALSLLVLAAGCASLPAADPVEEYRVAEGFASHRPADVAVLAVEGDLPKETAALLREALRRHLLDLRYAPVRVKEVDGRPSEFRPGGANAVLAVTISRWDDAALHGAGTVLLAAEVRLCGPGSADPLYSARLKDVRVDARRTSRTMEDRARAVEAAADEAAGILLAGLPPKGD